MVDDRILDALYVVGFVGVISTSTWQLALGTDERQRAIHAVIDLAAIGALGLAIWILE